tara:strand:+ start:869 stop:1495 length:627 start_codon:yes stop_codon:yes gene_type:complete
MIELSDAKLNSLKKYFIDNLESFDERFYVSLNKDLIKKIRNKKQAIQHVLTYGFKETRIIYSFDEHNKNLFLIMYPERSKIIHFLYQNKDKFDMDFYLEKYIDLKSLKIKELLWNHYIHDGLNESRELFKDEKINFTLFCLLHNIDLVIDGSDSDDEQDNNEEFEYEQDIVENTQKENKLSKELIENEINEENIEEEKYKPTIILKRH